jgi:hypothetical protein
VSDYRDFVHWQAEKLAGPEGERLWGYWRAQWRMFRRHWICRPTDPAAAVRAVGPPYVRIDASLTGD